MALMLRSNREMESLQQMDVKTRENDDKTEASVENVSSSANDYLFVESVLFHVCGRSWYSSFDDHPQREGAIIPQ